MSDQTKDLGIGELLSKSLSTPSGPLLVCAECRQPITGERNRIEVAGAHAHAFTNPEGHSFDVGCFDEAPGCNIHGIPTSEHSWFRGYRWSNAGCADCLSHLGWMYDGGDSYFFGLILGAIKAR